MIAITLAGQGVVIRQYTYIESVHTLQGKLLLNFMLMSAGYPAVSLKADEAGIAAYYRAIESFTRDVEGLDGSAMVDLVAHRLEDSVGQRMLQLEQARS